MKRNKVSYDKGKELCWKKEREKTIIKMLSNNDNTQNKFK